MKLLNLPAKYTIFGVRGSRQWAQRFGLLFGVHFIGYAVMVWMTAETHQWWLLAYFSLILFVVIVGGVLVWRIRRLTRFRGYE